jgi:hypothetical protein
MNAATLEEHRHLEAMAQAARSAEPSVSVELGANAKRETIPTVKLYAPLGCDEEKLRAHAEMVTRISIEQYETVTARYPAASGFVTNDGKK